MAGPSSHFDVFVGAFYPFRQSEHLLSSARYRLTRYTVKNADSLLGLQAPEPLAKLYSRDFYRATWMGTFEFTLLTLNRRLNTSFLLLTIE